MFGKNTLFLLLFSLLNGFVNEISAGRFESEDLDYEEGLGVQLWTGTVGPFNNPQETYDYYSLPFCKGNWEIGDYCEHPICKKCKCCKCRVKSEPASDIRTYFEIAFNGAKLENPSGLEILFKVDRPKREYCNKRLTPAEADAFVHAIRHNYWYQMSIDGLPTSAFVGQEDDAGTLFLFTHKRFEIGYNGPKIVSVDVIAEQKQQIEPNSTISFTYEVSWKQSEVHFDDRFQRYLDNSYLEFRDHRLSKFCSILVIVFLIIFACTKWSANFKSLSEGAQNLLHDDLDESHQRDTIHSNSFFFLIFTLERINGDPACAPLFTSFIAIGTGFIVALFAIVPANAITNNRNETLMDGLIFFYAILSSIISGLVGAHMYKQMDDRKHWLLQTFVGLLLFPLIWFSIVLAVNSVAIDSQVSRAVPVPQMMITMFFFSAVYGITYLPLALCIHLHNEKTEQEFTNVQEKKNDSEVDHIPAVAGPFTRGNGCIGPYLMALFGGFIIFASIYADLHFIFASCWSHKVYNWFKLLPLFAFISLSVSSWCVGFIAKYFLMKGGDYSPRAWTSFACGASVSLYIFAYATYFYYYHTKMSGLFQTTFYFGYNFLFSIVLGFFCGTLSFSGTLDEDSSRFLKM